MSSSMTLICVPRSVVVYLQYIIYDTHLCPQVNISVISLRSIWTGEVVMGNAADVGARHCTMFHIGVECVSKLWGPNGGKSAPIPCSLISWKRSVTT